MENRWKDFHSALPLAQVRLLYPPGIIPSPKVNISQQCLLCSTPHLPLKKKKEEVTEKRKDLGETGSGRRSGTLENRKRGSSWWQRMSCVSGWIKSCVSALVAQMEGCEPLRCANASFRNVYLDSCHESRAFKGRLAWTAAAALEACCSNHNLWFWCAFDGLQWGLRRTAWPSPLATRQGPFPTGNVSEI